MAIASTGPRWSLRVQVARPLARSHSWTVPSAPPVATTWPSGPNATAAMPFGSPSRGFSSRPSAIDQILSRSREAEASRLPTGEKATALTRFAWPTIVKTDSPARMSQIFTFPELPPPPATANHRPSPEKAMALKKDISFPVWVTTSGSSACEGETTPRITDTTRSDGRPKDLASECIRDSPLSSARRPRRDLVLRCRGIGT